MPGAHFLASLASKVQEGAIWTPVWSRWQPRDRGSGPDGNALCQVLVAAPAKLPAPGAGASVVASGDQFWDVGFCWASKAGSLAHTGTLGAI